MSKHVALKALVVMFGVVAMSLIATPSAIAQENPAGAALNQDLYFDLDFPGGTLEQYLDAIRKAHPGSNVKLSDESKTARIPAMKLNGVTLGAAVKLVNGDTLNTAGDTVIIWNTPVKIAGRIERAYRLGVTIMIEASAKGKGEKSSDQQIKGGRSNVWSLRDLVDAGMKMDDVLGAVRVALKTIDKPSQIRLHEPTSLLIVRGTKEQLELVDQTVSAMAEDVRKRSGKGEWTAEQIDDLQGELVKAQVERRIAEKRLEISSESLKRSRQNLEKRRPDLTDDQIVGAEQAVTNWELDIVHIIGKLQIAQDKVERLTKRLKRLQGADSESASQ